MITRRRIPLGRPSRTWSYVVRLLVDELASGRTKKRRVLGWARRARLRVGDPPVSVRIEQTDLLMPLSHMLPIYRGLFPEYSSNFPAIVKAVSTMRHGTVVVDIGANVGDTIALIRAVSDVPVLAIDGDEAFLPYLRRNLGSLGDVEIEATYVSTAGDAFSSSVVYRSGGTARLQKGSSGETHESLPLEEVLKRHPRFARPNVIKIDTDGHDAGIIIGNRKILDGSCPVIFFEYDPLLAADVGADHPRSVFDELVAMGFEAFFLYDNRGPLVQTVRSTDLQLLDDITSVLGQPESPAYLDVCAVHSGAADLIGPIAGAS